MEDHAMGNKRRYVGSERRGILIEIRLSSSVYAMITSQQFHRFLCTVRDKVMRIDTSPVIDKTNRLGGSSG
jgi:hypothetical protein